MILSKKQIFMIFMIFMIFGKNTFFDVFGENWFWSFFEDGLKNRGVSGETPKTRKPKKPDFKRYPKNGFFKLL